MTRAKILIVEDEPAIADAISYALESDGFATRTVHAGAEALPVITSYSIHYTKLYDNSKPARATIFLHRVMTVSYAP